MEITYLEAILTNRGKVTVGPSFKDQLYHGWCSLSDDSYSVPVRNVDQCFRSVLLTSRNYIGLGWFKGLILFIYISFTIHYIVIYIIFVPDSLKGAR